MNLPDAAKLAEALTNAIKDTHVDRPNEVLEEVCLWLNATFKEVWFEIPEDWDEQPESQQRMGATLRKSAA